MSLINRTEYMLRSRMPEFKRRERVMIELLERELDERCYVSFSAGKDSAVIAHACHQVRPGIPMLMVDSGCPYRWTEDEREMWMQFAETHGWALKTFHWDKWGRKRPAGSDAEYRAHVHADMFHDLTEWATANGLTRRVMGLRAEESPTRRVSLASDKGVSGKRICPISLWTANDVWAYHVKHGLPWVAIYDHLGPHARNGLIGRNGIAYGRMVYLRKHYPEAYRVARDLLGES